MNWSIDKDRKHAEHFLSRTTSAQLSPTALLPSVYYFVWYSQLLSPKSLPVRMARRALGKKVVAVATNDIRLYEDAFNKLVPVVDVWVSPSVKVSAFFEARSARSVQIPFYVSPKEFYRVDDDRMSIATKLGIDASLLSEKIVVGSFQRDSLGDDLSRPKWQKDPDVLIDICRKLPRERVLLLLAGPRRHYVVGQCRKHNIPYLFVGDERCIEERSDDVHVNNLPEDKMNLLYNLVDVYIVSSKSEGGPKAIMEASLARTLIVSTDVGLAPDFLHADLIYSAADTETVAKFISEHPPGAGTTKHYIDHNYDAVAAVMDEESYLSRYKELLAAL